MAYLEARAGLARAGVTYSGFAAPRFQITVSGVDRTSAFLKDGTWSIIDTINDGLSVFQSTVRGSASWTPTVGTPIDVLYCTPDEYLFRGHIMRVTTRAQMGQSAIYNLEASDQGWMIDRKDPPWGHYGQGTQGINTALQLLINSFTYHSVGSLALTIDGFAPGHIPNSLGAMPERHYDGMGPRLRSILTDVADAIGGYWRCNRRSRTIDLFVPGSGTDTNQPVLVNSSTVRNLSYIQDGTQIRNYNLVVGGGTPTTSIAGYGTYFVPVSEVGWFQNSTGTTAYAEGVGPFYVSSVVDGRASGVGSLIVSSIGTTFQLKADIPLNTMIRVAYGPFAIVTKESQQWGVTLGCTSFDGYQGHTRRELSANYATVQSLAYATYNIYNKPLGSLEYTTTDRWVRPGMVVSASISSPAAIQGSFIVEEVVTTPRLITGTVVECDKRVRAATSTTQVITEALTASVSDTVTISDTVLPKGLTASVSDTITASDIISPPLSLSLSVVDTIYVGELVQKTTGTLAPQQIEFLGYYRIPNTGFGRYDGMGRGTLALRKVSGATRLILKSDETSALGSFMGSVNELEVPTTAPSTTLSSCPVLTYVRTWAAADFYGTTCSDESNPFPSAMFWDESRSGIWWVHGEAYTGTDAAPISFTKISGDTATAYGPWRVSGINAMRARGSWIPVPSALKSAVGTAEFMVSGLVNSGVSQAPFGASLLAITVPSDPTTASADPPRPSTTGTVTGQTILWHGISNPQSRDTHYKLCTVPKIGGGGPYSCTVTPWPLEQGAATFGSQDTSAGENDVSTVAAWIETPQVSGLLYLGTLATTPHGYVAPYDDDGEIHMGYANYSRSDGWPEHTCCHLQADPYWGSTGPWAHCRVPMGWIYHKADIVARAGGSGTSYGVTPAHTFQVYGVDEMRFYPSTTNTLGGKRCRAMGHAAYDEDAGRLYLHVVEGDEYTVGEYPQRSCIAVFRVPRYVGDRVTVTDVITSAST